MPRPFLGGALFYANDQRYLSKNGPERERFSSNGSLRVNLDSWSRKIGADAHSAALSA
jgi:hypothetical protein